MAFRHRMGRGSSARNFRAKAHTHRLNNAPVPMRGGIRL